MAIVLEHCKTMGKEIYLVWLAFWRMYKDLLRSCDAATSGLEDGPVERGVNYLEKMLATKFDEEVGQIFVNKFHHCRDFWKSVP